MVKNNIIKLITFIVIIMLDTICTAQINHNIIVIEKLNNDLNVNVNNGTMLDVDSAFQSEKRHIDSNLSGIPLSQVPMKRDSSSEIINNEYGIIDHTFSGYDDSFIFFKNPQILEVKGKKFNLDSLLYKNKKYKIEYDFTQADIYRIKSNSKDLILIVSPERYFFHCNNCISQLLLVIDIGNSFSKIKLFEYACKYKSCGLLNFETLKSDKFLKILAKNKMNKYDLFKIKL